MAEDQNGEKNPDLVLFMETIWFSHSILVSIPPISVFSSATAVNSSSSPLNIQSVPAKKDLLLESITIYPKPIRDKERHCETERTKNGIDRSDSWSPSKTKSSGKNGKRERLVKIKSCKSLSELEYDELKGFMDLGFIFKEEHISPRMMSVVPGLQRFNKGPKTVVEDEHENKIIARPYLSEAWLINKPNSPFLKFHPPVISPATSGDMKKHLKLWARTVASEIHYSPRKITEMHTHLIP